ncbi:MAG: DUF2490 domain-containing protein, partial [Chitinophagaceae bacterium]|nr:DUF2490 domain-containing protein [Chitinophagaceae bacterium]
MKRLTNYAVTVVMILLSTTGIAQNTRLNDYNKVGWYGATGTFSFNSKWSAHLEYQWRRENYLKTWQQSLLR